MTFKSGGDIQIAREAQANAPSKNRAKTGDQHVIAALRHDKARYSTGRKIHQLCCRLRPDGKSSILVYGDQPTPRVSGKTTTDRRLGDGHGTASARTLPFGIHAKASLGRTWHKGGARKGWVCANRSENDEPHTCDLPRDHLAHQPAERDDRQPHLLGQPDA